MAQEVAKKDYQLPARAVNHLKEVQRLCEGMERAYGQVTTKCHEHFAAVFPDKASLFNHDLYLGTVRTLRPDPGTTTHAYRLFLAWTKSKLKGLPTKSGKLREARGMTFKRWALAVGREYDSLTKVMEQSELVAVDEPLVQELRGVLNDLGRVKAKLERKLAHPAYQQIEDKTRQLRLQRRESSPKRAA